MGGRTYEDGGMKNSKKNKALELLDEKISQFQKVLAEATYDTVSPKEIDCIFSRDT